MQGSLAIVDDVPYLHEAWSALVSRGDGRVTLGTVSHSWGDFIVDWSGTEQLVLLCANLHDHVPIALKVRALHRLGVAAVVVEDSATVPQRQRLLEEGALAVVSRSMSLHRLTEIVQEVPEALPPRRESSAAVWLTDREMQVSCLFCGNAAPTAGYLGALLGLSGETVRAHVGRTRSKYRAQGSTVSTRRQLRSALIDDGWLYPEV